MELILSDNEYRLYNLSLIIPTRNEDTIVEKNLISIFNYINDKFAEFELIISDYSNDQTPDIINNLSKRYPEIKYVPVHRKGIGIGMRVGFEYAQYDQIMLYPIDMSWELSCIEKSIQNLSNDNVVLASRGHKNSVTIRPLGRKFFSKLYNLLVNLFFNLNVSDTQCTIALPKSKLKEILEQSDSDTGFFQTQLLIYAKKNNLKIIEIPVFVNDTRKDSKTNPIPESISLFKEIWRERKKQRGTLSKLSKKE